MTKAPAEGAGLRGVGGGSGGVAVQQDAAASAEGSGREGSGRDGGRGGLAGVGAAEPGLTDARTSATDPSDTRLGTVVALIMTPR